MRSFRIVALVCVIGSPVALGCGRSRADHEPGRATTTSATMSPAEERAAREVERARRELMQGGPAKIPCDPARAGEAPRTAEACAAESDLPAPVEMSPAREEPQR